MQQKARYVQCKVIEANSAVNVETALNAWLAAAGEIDLVDKDFQLDGGTHTVIVWYTGGQ